MCPQRRKSNEPDGKETGCTGQVRANSPIKVATILPMSIHPRHLAVVLAAALAACALSGCGTINEKLAAGAGDFIPAWAGGLPADAPPRPGTAKYDEFMKERERKRLMPAAERGDEVKPAPSPQDAIH
jgi:hypothetical protein